MGRKERSGISGKECDKEKLIYTKEWESVSYLLAFLQTRGGVYGVVDNVQGCSHKGCEF